jgi:hypothetical protein
VDGFETTAAGWYRGSPDLPQCRTVLAPVKDVPLSRLPSAILDECCARRHRNAQVGAEKRRRQAEQKSKMARKKCLSKISVRYRHRPMPHLFTEHGSDRPRIGAETVSRHPVRRHTADRLCPSNERPGRSQIPMLA